MSGSVKPAALHGHPDFVRRIAVTPVRRRQGRHQRPPSRHDQPQDHPTATANQVPDGTKKTAVGWCGEDDCRAQLARDLGDPDPTDPDTVTPDDISFTIAIRPRDGAIVKLCYYCQPDYGKGPFAESGAEGQADGPWDQADLQAEVNNSEAYSDGVMGAAAGEAEGLAEGDDE